MAAPPAQAALSVPRNRFPETSHLNEISDLVLANDLETLKTRTLTSIELNLLVNYALSRYNRGYREMFEYYYPRMTQMEKVELIRELRQNLLDWQQSNAREKQENILSIKNMLQILIQRNELQQIPKTSITFCTIQ